MVIKPILFAFAAMLCGAPATVAALVFLPWSLALGFFSLPEHLGVASTNILLVVASLFALINYWLLAARTLKDLPFNLGWSFRIASVSALVSSYAVYDAMPVPAALVVVIPIWVATLWFLYKQRTIRSENNAV